MTRLTFRNVSKRFGEVEALVGLNLEVGSGEFFALVGSSGCGKSTAMRLAAGLEFPDDGDIEVDGETITHTLPREREFGLVTQQNAIAVNRSAAGTISLPLEARQIPRGHISGRVMAEADRLGIRYLLDRRRNELSGGETQAVQLARALVARPKVLLLDEPLARIDSIFRTRLRSDLIRIQREYGLTTLLITSDQGDAMVMADRAAVLDRGRLQQVGRPMDLYGRPVNLAVAGFFGEPAMNFLVGDAIVDGGRRLLVGGHRVDVEHIPARRFVRSTALIGVRPDDLHLGPPGGPIPGIPCIVDRLESRGPTSVVHLRTDRAVRADGERPARLLASCRGVGPRIGEQVEATIDASMLHLFDDVTEAALHHPA